VAFAQEFEPPKKIANRFLSDGSHKKTVEKPTPSYKMEYMGDGRILLDCGMFLSNEQVYKDSLFKFVIIDLEGKVRERLFPYDHRLYAVSNIYTKLPQFFKRGKGIVFNPIFENEVYIAERDTIFPILKVDFDGVNIDPNDLSYEEFHKFYANRSDFAVVSEYFAINNREIVYSYYKDAPYISVCGDSGCSTVKAGNIVNDIDGVPFSYFFTSNDTGELVSVVYPHELLAGKETGKILDRALDVQDNPIIAIYK